MTLSIAFRCSTDPHAGPPDIDYRSRCTHVNETTDGNRISMVRTKTMTSTALSEGLLVEGTKRVERIPEQWVNEVRRRVEAGREFKRAVTEVFTANAQLLVLWRKHQGR